MELKELNEKLADFPYVSGYTPSQADVEECKKVEGQNLDKFVNVKRWAKHMASFSDKEKKAFPGAPAPAAAASKGGDDDDDIDLFGSDDDEEADKAKAERAAKLAEQKKGAAKPGVIAKSNVILDIKVWDDETDLKQLEEEIRKISLDGLLWGKAQLVPVAFGMNKLQMVCVVEDEKVSVQDLTDQIEEMELVQSTDIAAFQKI